MHSRTAKLQQKSSKRFNFSTIFEARDWWISTLVSSILSRCSAIGLHIHFITGATKTIQIKFYHFYFSYLESQGDVILVEVQDNNRVVIGRAKIPVSSFTDAQVCLHKFMSLVQMFHDRSEKWLKEFLFEQIWKTAGWNYQVVASISRWSRLCGQDSALYELIYVFQ